MRKSTSGTHEYEQNISRQNTALNLKSFPTADEFGDVALHEQMIELIDSASWFDIMAGGMKCSLEDMDLVFAATLESGVRTCLSDRLLSRMNFTIMAHPSEESFVKIFSTNLALTFKEQNYPPEVSGVIPSIIQSTYKVYSECRRVLLEDPQGTIHISRKHLYSTKLNLITKLWFFVETKELIFQHYDLTKFS